MEEDNPFCDLPASYLKTLDDYWWDSIWPDWDWYYKIMKSQLEVK